MFANYTNFRNIRRRVHRLTNSFSTVRKGAFLIFAVCLVFGEVAGGQQSVRRQLFACEGSENLKSADGSMAFEAEPAEVQILIKVDSVVVGATPFFYSKDIPINLESEFEISFSRFNGQDGYSGNFNKVTARLRLADHHDKPPYWWAVYKCNPAKRMLD